MLYAVFPMAAISRSEGIVNKYLEPATINVLKGKLGNYISDWHIYSSASNKTGVYLVLNEPRVFYPRQGAKISAAAKAALTAAASKVEAESTLTITIIKCIPQAVNKAFSMDCDAFSPTVFSNTKTAKCNSEHVKAAFAKLEAFNKAFAELQQIVDDAKGLGISHFAEHSDEHKKYLALKAIM